MTAAKRKALWWLFKALSVIVSCALPIMAILEKFPLWTEEAGTGRSVGAGLVLILLVLLIVFRKTVFDFIRDRLNLKHAPPLTIWIVLIILSYSLIYISGILRDMNTVFWMGLLGCAIGTLLTYIAEHAFGNRSESSKKE